jgi:hypothetical protein
MSFEIGITFTVLSVALFLFSMSGRLKQSKGMAFIIILRAMASLFAFLAYSTFVASSVTYYPPENVISGNALVQYPAYNVTTSLPQGAQDAIGNVSLAWICLVLGSIAMDIVWMLRD